MFVTNSFTLVATFLIVAPIFLKALNTAFPAVVAAVTIPPIAATTIAITGTAEPIPANALAIPPAEALAEPKLADNELIVVPACPIDVASLPAPIVRKEFDNTFIISDALPAASLIFWNGLTISTSPPLACNSFIWLLSPSNSRSALSMLVVSI